MIDATRIAAARSAVGLSVDHASSAWNRMDPAWREITCKAAAVSLRMVNKSFEDMPIQNQVKIREKIRNLARAVKPILLDS